MGQYKRAVQISGLHHLNSAFSSNPNLTHKKIKFLFCSILYSVFIISLIIIPSCSGSKRFAEGSNSTSIEVSENINIPENVITENIVNNELLIRVLLSESSSKNIIAENSIEVQNDENTLAIVKKGNQLTFSIDGSGMKLRISDREFFSNIFYLKSSEDAGILKFANKTFRGRLKLVANGAKINFINQVSLEDYVKGVMLKEMPLGKGNDNYEALKAFSICARTYALMKIFEGKQYFDILPDTRDQVYGGVDGESTISNKIVDETKNIVLGYEDKPAIIFYHSTCGGFTEKGSNVFSKADYSYLIGSKDGSPSNCDISPRYNWTESFSGNILIERLAKANLIANRNFSVKNILINSKFNSGRVNELEFILKNSAGAVKSVKIYGNNIRSIIRSSDDKSILKSNFFDISKGTNDEFIFKGKGSGHGVGMCQWGAIGLSKNGTAFDKILNHYFPGTSLMLIP